jgi:NADH-quinone oxidoreductase subunit C
MSEKALSRLKQRFADSVLETHDFRGDETAVVDRAAVVEVASWLRDEHDLAFNMLTDMTAVDWLLEGKEPRFEVVYHFYSVEHRHRLRIKVQVPEEDPVVDTLTGLYGIADWLEREIWDMYGIRFKGHPNMKRILLYEEFVGHPLRKDYPKERRQPLVRRPENEIAEVLARRGKARPLPEPPRSTR